MNVGVEEIVDMVYARLFCNGFVGARYGGVGL